MSGCIYAFAYLLRFQWMPLPAVLAHPEARALLSDNLFPSSTQKIRCMSILLCMRAAPTLWPIQCQIRPRADVTIPTHLISPEMAGKDVMNLSLSRDIVS